MESNFDVRLRILADVAILAADFACMDPIRGTVISGGVYRGAALSTHNLTHVCGFEGARRRHTVCLAPLGFRGWR
ncbi:MAG: hypothetical protein QOF52_3119 [Propionibacteriaceae bacterium]|jgi:hypothetical protein|nr:hypothetical protein [Propionibacteriaceae bacterium]